MCKDEKINLKILEDFKKNIANKWPPELIDKTVKKVTSLETQNYTALATIESTIIHQFFKVGLTGYPVHFEGSTTGLSTPGFGSSAGLVFTDNLDKLVSDTRSFWFVGNMSYLGMYFYNDDGSWLGQFQGASLSLVIGGGTGRGEWS
ncbi:VapA/VapB family virulence-associated protein [Xenorhabdus szentirmaii]|uniref:Virulence associated protein VapA n=2 Tax=Xenorhabdus szentirmaii TaxID=290112 RepID=W1IWA6_9GAMM|nr:MULTISPECIES: VapA/VapB family virulence-associated protein [Xenorhabdus]MBD2780469.1 VapA/VapB family virulence-associated protein [Xenorhabdus sp. 38]MBD2791230.1 VapA/VapB family virulence-associated protein [Xenorhabdus sp. CUL]MBD2799642.1 VapA/VapB family virulence-associated protein [Xenorhabdus sp. M]MBD2819397.1 VapA/VapB family virulence-associated protein [Xenorhabdus sp. 42]MBD2826334.1 VapA/VapB family virulence-associated protein [Xenorhabdus sp. 5]